MWGTNEKTWAICKLFTSPDTMYTTRSLGLKMGISKSTIFHHLKYRSTYVCPHLVPEINRRLQQNKDDCAKRGKEALEKYRRDQNEQREVRKIKAR